MAHLRMSKTTGRNWFSLSIILVLGSNSNNHVYWQVPLPIHLVRLPFLTFLRDDSKVPEKMCTSDKCLSSIPKSYLPFKETINCSKYMIFPDNWEQRNHFSRLNQASYSALIVLPVNDVDMWCWRWSNHNHKATWQGCPVERLGDWLCRCTVSLHQGPPRVHDKSVALACISWHCVLASDGFLLPLSLHS